MISVQHFSFGYPGKSILENLTFDIPEKGLTALLGRNGAGKTTLFRCILGLLTGYSGQILINGKEQKAYSVRELSRKIAYIPQFSSPVFGYSVLDTVLMGTTNQLNAFHSPGEKEKKQAMAALDKLGITSLYREDFTHLSGGEKQMVLIARALAQNAPILLMDEPCSALDFGNQEKIMQIARELGGNGYTVLMTTHQPQHALSYAEHVLVIGNKKLLCQGKANDILTEKLMEEIYGVPVLLADTPEGKIIIVKKA